MIYQFDRFRLDTSSFEVWQDEARLDAQPQVIELLIMLLENRDRAVTREEIFDRVWKDRIVSDTTLSSRIKSIRQLLGDDGVQQKYIRTIHGRGFRFVADVTTETTDHQTGEHIEKPSIAVLPFDNLSTDPEQEYFADGITEDIITELSREKDLFVIARNSSSAYKGETSDITQIARDLGVQYVLEGSVRRSGNKIRLNAQLIDGETNHHIWAERYDRALEDIFEVQDDLSNTIMNTLVQKIYRRSFDRAIRRPLLNITAYDCYTRAMALLLRLNRPDNLLAQKAAKQATELDPNFARGYMTLAWAHLYEYFTGWSEDRALALDQAHEAALKAIDCNRDDFWGYTALGFAELFSNNHERALNAIDEAVRFNPNSADARACRAIILNHIGKPEEALQEVTLAMRHNPRHPDWYLIGPGRALFMMERYQEALPYLGKLVDAGDDIATWRSLLAATYMALGREVEAKTEIKKAIEIMPHLSISVVLSIIKMKDSEAVERYSNFLRMVGLPE